MPPMTTVASGRCTSAPAPVAIAMGTKPNEATSAVIRTGRNRVRAPSSTASNIVLPSCRKRSMNVIITKPLRTATPESAIKPMPALMESGMSLRMSANIPPVSERGTPLKTSNASAADPRLTNRSIKMRRSAIGTTMVKRCVADTSCSN